MKFNDALQIIDILNEELYGNMITAYHRSSVPPDEFIKFFNGEKEWKFGGQGGQGYGEGLYAVPNLKQTSNNKTTKMIYGKYIYKLAIKGFKNFYHTSSKTYREVFNKKTINDNEELKIKQLKEKNVNEPFDRPSFYARSKFDGIYFKDGGWDGWTVLLFNPKKAIPLSYSDDDGKTWKSLQHNKEQVKNLSNQTNYDKAELSKFLSNFNKKQIFSSKEAVVDKYILNQKDFVKILNIIRGGEAYQKWLTEKENKIILYLVYKSERFNPDFYEAYRFSNKTKVGRWNNDVNRYYNNALQDKLRIKFKRIIKDDLKNS